MELSIILAAGEGTRMKSKRSKVLHTIVGKSLLEYVLEASEGAGIQQAVVVCGENEDQVRARHFDGVTCVRQPIGPDHPYGTGYAAQCAIAQYELGDEDTVLVLTGDTPLIRGETLKTFVQYHQDNQNAATVLTALIEDPTGYGRIIKDETGQLTAIVEHKDATEDQRMIKEFNSGMFAFRGKDLVESLKALDTNNASGELYLTDVVQILNEAGKRVAAYCIDDVQEVYGINSKIQLSEAEAIMRRRINEAYMTAGVIMDFPDTVTIEPGVQIGQDTRLGAHVTLRGQTVIGQDCEIGLNTQIEDSTIGDRVKITQSVIESSTVEDDVTMGPFAHLRPGAHLGQRVHIGNFVEVKNASLGDDSKAGHLAYIGDADVGKEVNVGCGVVFVNYDGKFKHRSTIGDKAFLGSNANLVAPIHIKKEGFVAAGTTLTHNVGEGALAIGRPEYKEIEGYVAKKKARDALKEKGGQA